MVLSTDETGRTWRTAVEVELTRRTEVRVAGILRRLLGEYDDVVYHVTRSAAPVVSRAVGGLGGGLAERVDVRPYPPPELAAGA